MMAVVAVALLVSTAVMTAMYADANSRANSNQNEADRLSTLLSINYPVLEMGQASAQGKLANLVNNSQELSVALAETGLNSTPARRAMNATIASDAYIIDILTMDADGIILAAEPSAYSFMEGMDFSTDPWVGSFLERRMEVMSNAFPSTEGPWGASLIVPAFDTHGGFAGGILVLFDIGELVDDSIAAGAAAAGCTYDCVQPNGLIIAASAPSEVHLNVFTSPEFANYTQLRALMWRAVNETAGYGEYSFPATWGSAKVLTKDMFWVSIGFRGVEWRLMVQHVQ
jgi:hypothetical protein